MDTAELQNVARLLMIAQVAIPSVFTAGIVGAMSTAQKTIHEVVLEVKEGRISEDAAAVLILKAARVRNWGPLVMVFLFALATLAPALYVQEVGTDPLRRFIAFQLGLFVVGWLISTFFLVSALSDITRRE